MPNQVTFRFLSKINGAHEGGKEEDKERDQKEGKYIMWEGGGGEAGKKD